MKLISRRRQRMMDVPEPFGGPTLIPRNPISSNLAAVTMTNNLPDMVVEHFAKSSSINE